MSKDPNSATAETSYTLGVPEGQSSESTGKQGHNCCGGCCDVRRATIIVDIIHASLVGLTLFSILATRNMDSRAVYDDDAMAAAMDSYQAAPMGTAIAVTTLQFVAALCGIAGAIKYNVPLVGVAALGYVFSIINTLIQLNPIGLIYPAFFLYPHIYLIKEIRAGIMTEANYPNEKHSCCCV